jgi:hypothetical protein
VLPLADVLDFVEVCVGMYDLREVCVARVKSVFKNAPVHDEQNGEHQAHYPSYDMHCLRSSVGSCFRRVTKLCEVLSKGTAQ